jgi:hypothetical protein
MIVRTYSDKEFSALSTKEKLSFGAGNVKRVSRQVRPGKTVMEWKVYIV